MELPLPENTPEYMAPAYYGCLHWAIGMDDIRKEFEADTGTSMPNLPNSPIEAMIDKACGVDRSEEMKAYFQKFKVWHDENIWGDMAAPPAEGGE